MTKTLLLVGNQPDNLGDVILNKNLIDVFRRNGEVVVDDHYLDESYTSELDLESGEVSLLSKRDLPNPRSLVGMLALIFVLKRPYDIISRYPGHYFPRKGFSWLIHDLKMAIFYTLLKIRGIKVILVDVTIDTTHLKGLKGFLWRWQASQHELVSVRDKTIYEDLKQRGFATVKHVPDLFLLSTRDEVTPFLPHELRSNPFVTDFPPEANS